MFHFSPFRKVPIRTSLLTFALFSLFHLTCNAQSTGYQYNPKDSSFHILSARNGFGPTLGYRGIHPSFLEMGVTFAQIGHGVVGWELNYLSNLKFDDQYMHGLSLGYYKGFAIFEVGMNATSYSDFDHFNLTLRPHIDLGIGGLLVVGYGYNLPLLNSTLNDQINSHELRLMARWAIGAF